MTKEYVSIELDEIVRVFRILGEVNHFIHQPMNFDSTDKFAEKYHQEIANVYYKVIWNWIPPEVQEQLMEE